MTEKSRITFGAVPASTGARASIGASSITLGELNRAERNPRLGVLSLPVRRRRERGAGRPHVAMRTSVCTWSPRAAIASGSGSTRND